MRVGNFLGVERGHGLRQLEAVVHCRRIRRLRGGDDLFETDDGVAVGRERFLGLGEARAELLRFRRRARASGGEADRLDESEIGVHAGETERALGVGALFETGREPEQLLDGVERALVGRDVEAGPGAPAGRVGAWRGGLGTRDQYAVARDRQQRDQERDEAVLPEVRAGHASR